MNHKIGKTKWKIFTSVMISHFYITLGEKLVDSVRRGGHACGQRWREFGRRAVRHNANGTANGKVEGLEGRR